VDSGLGGTLGIASGIIADVQTILRLQAHCGQRSLEHARMRFGGSHLAGDHDLLEKTAQIMPGKNAAQAAVKIGKHHQTMIARKGVQSW